MADYGWPITATLRRHPERQVLMRLVTYEAFSAVGENYPLASEEMPVPRQRKALSLNVSSGGMLLLMEKAMHSGQVLRLLVSSIEEVTTPTLTEVRWCRPAPFASEQMPCFLTGVRFII